MLAAAWLVFSLVVIDATLLQTLLDRCIELFDYVFRFRVNH